MEFTLSKKGLHVRRALVDGALQMRVPQPLQQRLLNRFYYPFLSGHPGQRRMFGNMRRDGYWPNMDSYI